MYASENLLRLQQLDCMLLLQVPVLLRELVSKLPLPDVPHGTEGLIQTIWLLMTATIAVPAICKLPGGSPVLGFLVRFPWVVVLIRSCVSVILVLIKHFDWLDIDRLSFEKWNAASVCSSVC